MLYGCLKPGQEAHIITKVNEGSMDLYSQGFIGQRVL